MDKMRWRYGDTNQVKAAVNRDTVIENGDLVWQDGNNAKPASMLPAEQESLLTLPAAFARKFLGVALQRSRAEDTDLVRVATTGVFEFDCDFGTFELGDFIGLVDPPGGSRLSNQYVCKVGNKEAAIGRAAKFEHQPTSRVLVDIRSTIMTGGV